MVDGGIEGPRVTHKGSSHMPVHSIQGSSPAPFLPPWPDQGKGDSSVQKEVWLMGG
jgi:hypothetical protein